MWSEEYKLTSSVDVLFLDCTGNLHFNGSSCLFPLHQSESSAEIAGDCPQQLTETNQSPHSQKNRKGKMCYDLWILNIIITCQVTLCVNGSLFICLTLELFNYCINKFNYSDTQKSFTVYAKPCEVCSIFCCYCGSSLAKLFNILHKVSPSQLCEFQ